MRYGMGVDRVGWIAVGMACLFWLGSIVQGKRRGKRIPLVLPLTLLVAYVMLSLIMV